MGSMGKEPADPKALLQDVNPASQTVSIKHLTFMAVCAYVLVVVFSSSDAEFLVGKSDPRRFGKKFTRRWPHSCATNRVALASPE